MLTKPLSSQHFSICCWCISLTIPKSRRGYSWRKVSPKRQIVLPYKRDYQCRNGVSHLVLSGGNRALVLECYAEHFPFPTLIALCRMAFTSYNWWNGQFCSIAWSDQRKYFINLSHVKLIDTGLRRTTLAAIILDSVGLYCETSWNPRWGHIYVRLVLYFSFYTCQFFGNFKDRHHHFPLGHSRYVLLDPAVCGSGGGAVAPQAASETFLGQSSRYVLFFHDASFFMKPFPSVSYILASNLIVRSEHVRGYQRRKYYHFYVGHFTIYLSI